MILLFGRWARALLPPIAVLWLGLRIGSGSLAPGGRFPVGFESVVVVNEVTHQFEVGVEFGMDWVTRPAAADGVLLRLHVLRPVAHD